MFIASPAAFAVTSTACGLAATATQLIVFRALQGVSAAMLSPQALATIQIVLPPRKCPRAYAAQGATLALASMMGPALAGLLITANLFGLTWRPVFLINLPISLVAIIAARRLIPTMRSPLAKSLDIGGSIIVHPPCLGTLMIGRSLGLGVTGLLFAIPLPTTIEAASTGQLVTGMRYGILYSPRAFALSLLIIKCLPMSRAPSEKPPSLPDVTIDCAAMTWLSPG